MSLCDSPQYLQLDDHRMTWYQTGDGPAVLFLHGCYDTLLYRPLLDLFANRYHCITYDQRGAERSRLSPPSADALHVDRFVADLESLRQHLRLDRLTLIGHSWGTGLALLYALRHPAHVDQMVLIGPGLLCPAASDVYRANVQRVTDLLADDVWSTVSEQYRQALRTGRPLTPEADAAYIHIWSRVMVFSHEQAERFARDYLAAGGIARRPPNAVGLDDCRLLERAPEITCPTLILHGHQDYEPIAQACELTRRLPAAQLVLLNRCGHLTWLDQPQATFDAIHAFLGGQDLRQ
jgi:proline iminopeptidase